MKTKVIFLSWSLSDKAWWTLPLFFTVVLYRTGLFWTRILVSSSHVWNDFYKTFCLLFNLTALHITSANKEGQTWAHLLLVWQIYKSIFSHTIMGLFYFFLGFCFFLLFRSIDWENSAHSSTFKWKNTASLLVSVDIYKFI